MSKTTHFLNNLSTLASANDEYVELLKKKQEEVTAQRNELLPSLKERINLYNSVLADVLRKFQLLYAGWNKHSLLTENQIDWDFTPETSHVNSAGELMLVDATKNVEVPYKFLQNDPIIVAQHARRLVRKYQLEQARKTHATASEKQKQLETELAALQKKLDEATKEAQLSERIVNNRTKFILEKQKKQ
jgi:hypothetical protein